MLTEIKDVFDKINKDRFVIGYDMTRNYVQISYCRIDSENPETFSTVLGQEEYKIPFVLLKKNNSNQWLIGADALKAYEEGEGDLIQNIFESASKETNVRVGRDEYRACDLLALFLRKSLALLSIMSTPDKVAEIVITLREANVSDIRTLQKAVSMLKVNLEKVHYISYEESFFFYMLNQGGELQKHHILLCDSIDGHLSIYRLERNRFVNPAVATVERFDYPDFRLGREGGLSAEEKDKIFLEIVTSHCENTVFSGIYLIGENFYDDWCRESLRYLCKGRRVFKGNNLFSKGACFAAKEKAVPTGYEKKIRFLGKDRLKASIGVEVLKDGKKITIPLATAGDQWYEVNGHCELILRESNCVTFVIDFLSRRGTSLADFKLEGLPVRPNRVTRISLDLSMTSEKRVKFIIKDMGFGEIYPSTGKDWTDELELE